MSLPKQSLPINFLKGLDTKTDPFQVAPGSFLALSNTIFTKAGLLQKRNGFNELASLPSAGYDFLTTYNNGLIAIGEGLPLASYSTGSESWAAKGKIEPIQVSVLPLYRSGTNQTQCDSAQSSTGLICTVFTDNVPVVYSNTVVYRYQVSDASGSIVKSGDITSSYGNVASAPKVWCIGQYFLIVFNAVSGASLHLQYVSINLTTLAVSDGIDISTVVTGPFDGVVINNSLYISWSFGSGIKTTFITATLVIFAPTTTTTTTADYISVCSDITGTTPIVWTTIYNVAGSIGKAFSLDNALNSVLAATTWTSAANIVNIATTAAGHLDIFYETSNAYGYDATIPTNYLSHRSMTNAGTPGTAAVFARSVGLASKAFLIGGNKYFLVAYQSDYQPTYFLWSYDVTAGPIARIAYSNGGGYCTQGLPNVHINGTLISIPYLYKDSITPVNKATNPPSGTQVNGIYSQTGVNLATFDLSITDFYSSEIGNNIHFNGGYLWMHDGSNGAIMEHGFHVWPDSIEATWTENSVVTPTGYWDNGSTIITVSSATGIYPGMTIADTHGGHESYIQAGTIVVSISGTTVTISKPTTHVVPSISADALSIQGNIASKPDTATNTDAYNYMGVYEWTDNQGQIHRSAPSLPVSLTTTGAGSTGSVAIKFPTLRLTAKTGVKLVLYRWSLGQQVYYQVTSVSLPIMNDKSIDYVTIYDVLSDETILGNSILYTTGGVVENIGAPACSAMTLFDSRLWLIDSEDKNLLWYSKQVVETVPVETSDLFTIYVAPTQGAQGSTGPMTALYSMDDKLIIFKRDAIYYLNGAGPSNTGANSQYSQPIFITSTVGCANQNSLVMIPNGILFQSDKGIWLLGRDLSTNYLGAPVEAFNSATVKSALTIPGTNQVRFVLDSGISIMYDYYFNAWDTPTGIPAVSSTLFENKQTFINQYSQTFQETPGAYLDGANPTLISFKTGWFNLAGLQGFERIYFFYLLGSYISPHKLQIQIAYDYNPAPQQQVIINPQNYSGTFGSDTFYGGSQAYGGMGSLEQFKVYFDQQKVQSFQLTFQEIYDSTIGGNPGAGLNLSGINIVFAGKKPFVPLAASQQVG